LIILRGPYLVAPVTRFGWLLIARRRTTDTERWRTRAAVTVFGSYLYREFPGAGFVLS
jgi:hypothetical protein